MGTVAGVLLHIVNRKAGKYETKPSGRQWMESEGLMRNCPERHTFDFAISGTFLKEAFNQLVGKLAKTLQLVTLKTLGVKKTYWSHRTLLLLFPCLVHVGSNTLSFCCWWKMASSCGVLMGFRVKYTQDTGSPVFTVLGPTPRKKWKAFQSPAESIVLCQSRLIIALFIIIIIIAMMIMMIKSNWCWSRPDVRLARRCRGLIASEPLREHKPI